jgi:15-cis-phytoene desaturase
MSGETRQFRAWRFIMVKSQVQPETQYESTDVVIVGGGLSGLTAALGLQGEGVQVLVLEKESLLGGRARSWIDPTTGDPIHIGPHILLSEYPNMLKLLDRLGTRNKVVWERDHFMVQTIGSSRHVLRQAPMPAPFHFLPSMVTYPLGGSLDKLSNVLVSLYCLQASEDELLALDNENAHAFLKRMGVSDGFISQFWNFTSLSIMNVPLELCSAGALMRFFQKFIGYTEWYFGFADGGLGDLYAPAAKAAIEAAGGEVRLNTQVQGLLVEQGGVQGVMLSDGRVIRARHTIMAVPPQTLYQLGPRAWRRQYSWFDDLSYFHPCPYKSIYVWYDHKVTDLRMWARCYQPGDLNCDFYDISNINSGWQGRHSLITSNIIFSQRVEELTDEELVKLTVAEIAEVHPSATFEHVTHSVVNHIPMAIHCPFPGTEKRRPDSTVGVAGLVLAGDYVRTHLPASMESAVCSGWMAAEAVLAARGKTVPLRVPKREIDGVSGLINRTAYWLPHKVAGRLMSRNRWPGRGGEGPDAAARSARQWA